MPRRGLPLVLLALLLAGCSAPAPPAPPGKVPHLVALDGRWDFPRERADALLAESGLGPAAGAAWFGTALVRTSAGPAAADYAAFEPGALALLAPNATAPVPGEVVLSADFARRHGLAEGAALELRTWRWPTPLVSTSFEMERTRPCDPASPAKLCFGATLDETETELRLRVDEGGQDLAFLPDLAELGAGNTPAWWNGSFIAPSGREHGFQASVDAQGFPRAGELNGTLEAGSWTLRYHLETLRSGRLPAGLAGIVRLREPGYHWFDDRLQRIEDPDEQARSVLASATPLNLTLRVRALADLPPLLNADVLLSSEDARAIEGPEGPGPARVGGLVLLAAAPEAASKLAAAREGEDNLVAVALHARPLVAPPPRPAPAGALLLLAPPDLDASALPPVEGALAPTLALALRPGVGLPVSIEGRNLTVGTVFLAHADLRPAPWTLPPGARWATSGEALENLTRSRTLLLASDDLAARDVSVARLAVGDESSGRIGVVVGAVDGGPRGVLWAAAPFAAGAGEPEGARLVVPLAPGADPDAVLARALAAWAPFGVAPEPSRKA